MNLKSILFAVALGFFGVLAYCMLPVLMKGTNDVTLLLQPLNKGDSAHLPYVIAVEKGFFKDAGLNVTVKRKARFGDSDVEIMGRTQFYVELAKNPAKYKLIAAGVQDKDLHNDAIVVRADIKAASLKDVKGISAFPYLGGGPACGPVIKMMLSESGIEPKDISVYSIKPEPFAAGNFSVAYMREPFLSVYLEKASYRILIDGPIFASRILTPWPMAITALTGNFLTKRPGTAAKVVAAFDKAIEFIHKNPEEAETIFRAYLEKETGIKGLKTRPIRHLRSDQLSPEIVQRQSDWYFDNRLTSGRIDAKTVFYSRPATAGSN